MKVATWNVNGIRARSSQVVHWIDGEEPDVICLQEIKASQHQVPEPLNQIAGYHAHVYYDSATREQARQLCDAAGKRFALTVGRMHDNPVGPHPRGSCQLTFAADRLAEVLPWLVLNRRLGLGGSSSRIRRSSSSSATWRSVSRVSGVVPVKSSYRSTPRL